MIDRGLVDLAMREMVQNILARGGRIVMQAPPVDEDRYVVGWTVTAEYESATTIISVAATGTNLAQCWVELHRLWDDSHPDRFESRP